MNKSRTKTKVDLEDEYHEMIWSYQIDKWIKMNKNTMFQKYKAEIKHNHNLANLHCKVDHYLNTNWCP